MGNKLLFFMMVVTILFSSCDLPQESSGADDESNIVDSSSGATPSVTLSFEGTEYGQKSIYVAWIEDESGNNLQNLYVCNKLISGGLTGTALPYWKTLKYDDSDVDGVDGVSGASTQAELTVVRDLSIGSTTSIRVCFDIDRSLNNNDHFGDRPAYTYKTDLIDVSDLSVLTGSFNLTMRGWMSNETVSGSYSQAPTDTISGWDSWVFMTDLTKVENTGGGEDDLVTSLTVSFAE